jgi:cyclic pyranopterin phosphate synthase
MASNNPILTDPLNRQINYLRISVTDRCNLRCVYCMPPEGVPPLVHADILSYEEIFRIAEISVGLGIRKIRLTGGEPLVRRGLVPLVARLARLTGLADLSLTTNGTLLGEHAGPLRDAGLRRINVSLDTLRPERYRAITRHGELQQALDGISAAAAAGILPIKINTVTLREFNADEAPDFARLTLAHPYEIRFIEFMPVGEHNGWQRDRLVPGDEILQTLGAQFDLESLPPEGAAAGPGRLYRIRGASGRIGFINPMTDHFCHLCNRLRLTPNGRLRTCLFDDGEVDLRARLRAGAGDAELAETIRAAILRKPARHPFHDGHGRKCTSVMSRIGG